MAQVAIVSEILAMTLIPADPAHGPSDTGVIFGVHCIAAPVVLALLAVAAGRVRGATTIDHGPTFHCADIRYVATGGLKTRTSSGLRLTMNPALGYSGTCYGDSGGPNFLGAGATETNIVAATTITGDYMCRATNVGYRMDMPSARAFLGQYVTLP